MKQNGFCRHSPDHRNRLSAYKIAERLGYSPTTIYYTLDPAKKERMLAYGKKNWKGFRKSHPHYVTEYIKWRYHNDKAFRQMMLVNSRKQKERQKQLKLQNRTASLMLSQ